MAKVQLFEKELQEMSALCKALAHPARLAILKYLAETKTCIKGDISDELPLSRTTVHQHLEELKKQNLIKGDISGMKTNYCLNPGVISRAKDHLDKFLSELHSDDSAVNC